MFGLPIDLPVTKDVKIRKTLKKVRKRTFCLEFFSFKMILVYRRKVSAIIKFIFRNFNEIFIETKLIYRHDMDDSFYLVP